MNRLFWSIVLLVSSSFVFAHDHHCHKELDEIIEAQKRVIEKKDEIIHDYKKANEAKDHKIAVLTQIVAYFVEAKLHHTFHKDHRIHILLEAHQN